MTKGTVLRIEKSSIHDGPGIRTIVFFKGCPMRCKWCSTPESHSPSIQIGFQREKCTGCGKCREVCVQYAIELPGSTIIRRPERCTGCVACATVCRFGALIVYGMTMTAGQVMDEIRKDEVFYFHSGGGVTLSGGEPLSQPEFAGEILAQCKSEGIHTAVETSLYAPFTVISGLLENIDYLYVDIKHADPAKHLLMTGADNAQIIENLKMLDKSSYAGELRIRVPLVPGQNDGDGDLEAIARICSGLRKPSGIELLPYHRLGAETYRRLGLAYECAAIKAPEASRVADRAEFLEKAMRL